MNEVVVCYQCPLQNVCGYAKPTMTLEEARWTTTKCPLIKVTHGRL